MAHYDCRHCGASPLEDCDCHLKWKPVKKLSEQVNKIKKIEYIDKDWVKFVCNHTRDEIVEYFKGFHPDATFAAEAGYKEIESDAYFKREETDEEYELRIAQEARQIKAAAELGAQVNAANRKNIEDAIAQLQEQLRSMS